MTCKELRDIEEVVNLAKEEIEKGNKNVTAILDYQDLKSLVTLWYYYCEETTKNNCFLDEFLKKDELFKLLEQEKSLQIYNYKAAYYSLLDDIDTLYQEGKYE